ncbi:tetratricopeptide repeat protein [Roseimaritima ulvae]|uniref:Serine/threonine-protein kinase PknD n=1 Tax=Roseimaritima ulvae TaxID=980254 RepID=A0A5B9QSG9_9BACT|nr:tetratricopeptide repeat protein [Roseimaritima ulvae]QEG42008.1 Serine/threonine-protein kinase PknD [Roseimaritima ulvae]
MSNASPLSLLTGLLTRQLGVPVTEDWRAAIAQWLDDPSQSLQSRLRDRQLIDEPTERMLASLVDRSTGDNPDADPDNAAQVDSDATRYLTDPQNQRIVIPDTSSEATGRYHKLRDHAQGGLGQVFVAIDDELNRQVALKQIQQRFAGDPDARQRFLLEAEITGGLEHPGVVPVYGLGVYEDGQPYYAMRFIRGESLEQAIRDFHARYPASQTTSATAPARMLELRKLLGRMIDVCQAIAYAHSRGVLHRDIKPDNVMLGKFGETLVVDWGLAKVADQEEIASSPSDEPRLMPASGSGAAPTRMGSVIGTPAFMSPEQAAGRLQDLDARSEVYSLGASLYCLLVGKPPLESRDQQGQPLPMTELLQRVQSGRFTPPRSVDPSVPKPLAAICQRAMETAPESRYADPLELAEDLERWMADEPVAAYRETWLERFRRWVKRHQSWAAAIASVVALSIVGLSVFLVVLRGKNSELRRAEARAREEAAIATSVTEFLNEDLLAQASPADHPNPRLEVRTLFHRAAASLDDQFQDQPLVKASLLNTIGVAQKYLGQLDNSETALTAAYQLRTQVLGKQHPDTLATQSDLASLHADRGRYQQARALLETTLESETKLLGETHENVLATQVALANLYLTIGEYDRAEQAVERLLTATTELRGADHPDTLECLSLKVRLLNEQGRLASARDLARDLADRTQQLLGEDHLVTLYAKTALAQRLFNADLPDQAWPIYVQVLESLKRVLGERHPYVWAVRSDMAMIEAEQSDPLQALTTLREIAADERDLLGPNHRESILSQTNVAIVLAALNRHDEAIELYRQGLDAAAEALGTHSSVADQLRVLLATSLYAEGDVEAAEPLLTAVLEPSGDTPQGGSSRLLILEAHGILALLRQQQGRLEEAIEHLQTARHGYLQAGLSRTQAAIDVNRLLLAVWVAVESSEQMDAAETNRTQTVFHPPSGRGERQRGEGEVLPSQACPQAEALLEQIREQLGDADTVTIAARIGLADAYLTAGYQDPAMPHVQAADAWFDSLDSPDPLALQQMAALADTFRQLQQLDRAIEVLQQTVDGQTKRLGAQHAQTVLSMHDLAYTLGEAGRYQEAEHLYEVVVRRRTEIFGADGEYTLLSLENLAQLQIEMGNTAGAIDSLNQLYEARKSLADDDPDKIEILFHLAELNRSAENYQQAAEYYEATIKGRVASLGEQHPDTLYAMHQWAYVCDYAGDQDEAVELYKRVVQGRSDTLGRAHPHTLLSLSNWAYIEAFRGNFQAAAERYEDWLNRVVEAEGADSPATLEPRYQWAGMMYLLGDYALAAKLMKQNVDLQRAAITDEADEATRLEFAGMLVVLGDSESHAGQHTAAGEHAREGLKLLEALQPDASLRFRAMSIVGASRAMADEFAEAEPMLLAAYEGLTNQAYDMQRARRLRLRVDTVNRLIELFSRAGNDAAVEAWRRTFEELDK